MGNPIQDCLLALICLIERESATLVGSLNFSIEQQLNKQLHFFSELHAMPCTFERVFTIRGGGHLLV